ncbi:caffeoylshikimate esterase-like [Olea europaea subsp. europaea]|uniref:Caffeoylshikimate esterase-like n=2 Tax=Olea europaea subsp. europaea TaxID=158383 RepID=A0A8S0VCL2_OLEEU|nr:caffeoylshikimate esterase-like [Olea europaea subsp. europaea]
MATKDGSIKFEEEYILNSRGVKLFTCRWVPENSQPKALIFLCHGYALESSISMKGCAIRLVNAGYEVHGIDYEGHGKSSGLLGYIPSFDNLVDDCSEHFTNICEKEENVKRMRIIMGESMGGAVVLRLHRKKPNYWDGGVLVAPMCKIAEDMRPSPLAIKVLTMLTNVLPTWKLTPTQDIVDLAFRDPQVRKEIRSNPYAYKGRPRLQTSYQLYNASLDLEKRLEEVSFPFLILHGEDDKVTDPSVSKILYESARSEDKTFKLYPGMWHSLSYGELPENLDIVFSDTISWLNEKVSLGNSRIEEEQKLANDHDALKKPESSKNES